MSNLQIQLYQYYLENFTKGSIQGNLQKTESGGLFSDFQELSRVWTHPKALLLASRRREAKTAQSKDSKISGGKKKAIKKNAAMDEDDYLIWSDEGEDGISFL